MDDLIRRSDAIRVASGYCHWTNIPDELAKLPFVSTENPNRCGDAVSRQAAIDALNDMSKNYEKNGKREYHPHIDFVIDVITMLPSVSTEKTGRWKKIKSGDKNFPESIVCSRCGYENSYINEWNFNNEPLSKVFKTSKYCPNCGARMEVEE